LASEDDDAPTLADLSPGSTESCAEIPLPFLLNAERYESCAEIPLPFLLNAERYDFEAEFVTFYDPVAFKI
jgi:hypothetical protein